LFCHGAIVPRGLENDANVGAKNEGAQSKAKSCNKGRRLRFGGFRI